MSTVLVYTASPSRSKRTIELGSACPVKLIDPADNSAGSAPASMTGGLGVGVDVAVDVAVAVLVAVEVGVGVSVGAGPTTT